MIATNPATAPVATPTAPIFLNFTYITSPHVNAAAAAAVLVTRKALRALPSAARPEPALNPNHPNQSKAAPNTTKGTL